MILTHPFQKTVDKRSRNDKAFAQIIAESSHSPAVITAALFRSPRLGQEWDAYGEHESGMEGQRI